MLNQRKIYVFRKDKFLKKADHSQYWYKISYLYIDDKGFIQSESEYIDKMSWDLVDLSFGKDFLGTVKAYDFKGHYVNYRFKADELIG